jgi:hypothetical protein
MSPEKPSQIATWSLVLTPRGIRKFGRRFVTQPVASDAVDTPWDLFQNAIREGFLPIATARSAQAFDASWENAVIRYSEIYDRILDFYIRELGPTHFRLAYLKAIAEPLREFEDLSAAINDLAELYQRHVADSINVATNSEYFFQTLSGETFNRINTRLRQTNYGITFLFLLLTGEVHGPMWVFQAVHDRTQRCLGEVEVHFESPISSRQVFNSLKFPEGAVDDLFPIKPRK